MVAKVSFCLTFHAFSAHNWTSQPHGRAFIAVSLEIQSTYYWLSLKWLLPWLPVLHITSSLPNEVGAATLFILAAVFSQEKGLISLRPHPCSASLDLLLPAQLDRDALMNERGCGIVRAVLWGWEQSAHSGPLSRFCFGDEKATGYNICNVSSAKLAPFPMHLFANFKALALFI